MLCSTAGLAGPPSINAFDPEAAETASKAAGISVTEYRDRQRQRATLQHRTARVSRMLEGLEEHAKVLETTCEIMWPEGECGPNGSEPTMADLLSIVGQLREAAGVIMYMVRTRC
jgi:hypothetical protein